MTYTVSAVLGVVGALALDLALLRTRLVLRPVFWATYPVVFVFQLIFNGVLTGRGVVVYRDDSILGPRLISAPIEDLAFGFALVLMTLALWVWLEGRGAGGVRPSQRPSRRWSR
jgi:lycopene cyclase domain-containing protein